MAYVDREQHRHIDGQDRGPAASLSIVDGGYEWFQAIHAEYTRRLFGTLEGADDADILILLHEQYPDSGRCKLERRIRESGISSASCSRSG